MRLQLTRALAASALVAIAANANADGAVEVGDRAAVYQDTDRTTVVTNVVSAHGNAGEHVGIDAHYLVDTISSASVDVVSAATTVFHEVRHEVMGGAGLHDPSRSVTAGYIYSVENDWSSHTGTLALSHDFLEHNVTLSLGGTFQKNDVGRARDPSFHRELVVGGGGVDLAIVASPDDLVDLGYSVAHLDGYQASPYRYAVVRAAGTPLGFGAPETVPETRTRHALTLKYNHHLFRDSAVRTQARGYLDDWGVVSATAGAEYVIGMGGVELAPFARGYVQRGASFYQASYARPMLYMTADRELSPFVDAFGGARLRGIRKKAGPFTDLYAEIQGTAFAFRYFDFPRLPARSGGVGELGAGVTF